MLFTHWSQKGEAFQGVAHEIRADVRHLWAVGIIVSVSSLRRISVSRQYLVYRSVCGSENILINTKTSKPPSNSHFKSNSGGAVD